MCMTVATLHLVVAWPNRNNVQLPRGEDCRSLEVSERVAAVADELPGYRIIDEPKALRLFTSSAERFC